VGIILSNKTLHIFGGKEAGNGFLTEKKNWEKGEDAVQAQKPRGDQPSPAQLSSY
jgi:hypothetical protein